MSNGETITQSQVLEDVDRHLKQLEKIDKNLDKTSANVQNALDKAKEAKSKTPGYFSGKIVAIEALQEAVLTQANVTEDLYDNQKVLHEQIMQLSENTKKLFVLGVSNMAYTRAIISRLKTKTKEPLTETARQQLLGLITDLENQADAYDKITRLKNNVSNLAEQIHGCEKAICHLNDILLELQNNQLLKEGSDSIFNKVNTIQNYILDLQDELNSKIDDINRRLGDSNYGTRQKSIMWASIIFAVMSFIMSFICLIK